MRIILVSTGINESFWLFEKDPYFPSTSYLINGTRLNFSYKDARFFEGLNEDMSLEADITVTPVIGQGHHVSMALLNDKVGNPNTLSVYEVFAMLNYSPPYLCPYGVLSKQDFQFSDLLNFDSQEKKQQQSDNKPAKVKKLQQWQNRRSKDDLVFTAVESGEKRGTSKQAVTSNCRRKRHQAPQLMINRENSTLTVRQPLSEKHQKVSSSKSASSRVNQNHIPRKLANRNLISGVQRRHHHVRRSISSNFKTSSFNNGGPFHMVIGIAVDHALLENVN